MVEQRCVLLAGAGCCSMNCLAMLPVPRCHPAATSSSKQ